MAKKAKPTQQEPDAESGMSIVKLRLTANEAKLIRLAAASNNQRVGAYARAVVLVQAKKDLQAAKDSWL